MATQKYTKGTIMIQKESGLTELLLIAEGSVNAYYEGCEIHLGKGDCIGLCDLAYGSHTCTYTATEDTTVLAYKLTPGRDTLALPGTGDYDMLLFNSMLRQTCGFVDALVSLEHNSGALYQYLQERHEEYVALCAQYIISPKTLPGFDALQPFSGEESLEKWLCSYYEALNKLPAPNKKALIASRELLKGLLLKASIDMHVIFSIAHMHYEYEKSLSFMLLNEEHLDFLDLYTGLLDQADRTGADTSALSATISHMLAYMEGLISISRELYKQRSMQYRTALEASKEGTSQAGASSADVSLKGSLETILRYGEIETNTATAFKANILAYKQQQDRNAQTDEVAKLRHALTKDFYEIYNTVFQVALPDQNIPLPVKMFLTFGYVDEELAGAANAAYLASVVNTIKPDPDHGVYTLFEWLKTIYSGEKEPSRNAFDADFPAYVRELRTSGEITVEVEKQMLQDNAQKVLFELKNLFPSANKVTYGRVSTFCPLFSEHNVLKELKDMFVTAKQITESFNAIRAIDFTAFYRDTGFSYPAAGINQEFVPIEILPDVVLFPNVGTRGSMWQEISGRNRNTPARMMLPIFALNDLFNIIVRLTGEYRWEICRRIQGSRWNDLSDPSLTSEYCDYIQFYRKNHELSADAKEKIKTALVKARNSTREMFVMDYVLWVQYESAGSPRLNKISRTILFSYCPFASQIRARLQVNPLYRELLTRYDIKTTQKLHRMDNLLHRFTAAGIEIPEELKQERIFIES